MQEVTKTHDLQLSVHTDYFNSMAAMMALCIENINMQMESETSDLLDRRMMQLFAVSKKQFDKGDVQNVSKLLSGSKNLDLQNELVGKKLL